MNKKIRYLQLSVIFLLATAVLFAHLFYEATIQISKLDTQINKRDSLIQELSKSNNLIKEYFDEKYDTLSNSKYYVLKDSKKTRREIQTIRDVEYIKTKELFKRNGNVISSDSLVKEFNLLTKKNSVEWKTIIDKYNSLVNDYNELFRKYRTVEDSLYIKSLLIKYSEKQYNIKYNYTIKNNEMITSLSSPKLDSALMLLDVYRNKLLYDPKKKRWIIKR